MNADIINYILQNGGIETQREMASKLNVSTRTVSRYSRKLGINRARRVKVRSTPTTIHEFTFESLYRKYRPLATWIAFRIVGDSHEAEEVVSISFISIFGRWEMFESEAHAWGYLRKTIENRSLNRRRDRRSNRKRSEPIDPVELRGRFEHLQDNTDHQKITAELIDMLQKHLTPPQQKVVQLRMDGLSEKEISKTLGIRRSNVNTYWIAALRKMKKKILNMTQYHQLLPQNSLLL